MTLHERLVVELGSMLNPVLNKDIYNSVVSKVKDLTTQLGLLTDSHEDAFKSLYYLSELNRITSNWPTIFNWPDEERIKKLQEISFEDGATGIPVKTSLNCPHCGLTPLTSSYYCNTCSKYVIFEDGVGGVGNLVLELKEDVIIVRAR